MTEELALSWTDAREPAHRCHPHGAPRGIRRRPRPSDGRHQGTRPSRRDPHGGGLARRHVLRSGCARRPCSSSASRAGSRTTSRSVTSWSARRCTQSTAASRHRTASRRVPRCGTARTDCCRRRAPRCGTCPRCEGIASRPPSATSFWPTTSQASPPTSATTATTPARSRWRVRAPPTRPT